MTCALKKKKNNPPAKTNQSGESGVEQEVMLLSVCLGSDRKIFHSCIKVVQFHQVKHKHVSESESGPLGEKTLHGQIIFT